MYDAINIMASYQAISDMKDGTEEILNAIVKDTSNPTDLRNAAFDCVQCFNNGYDSVLTTILEGNNAISNAAFRTIFDMAVDKSWDALIDAIPGASVVLATTKGMRVLSDAVFAMDDTCKTYYQFQADVALENAVRNVMDNMKYDYMQDSNLEHAAAYMRAVQLYKNIVLKGYDYTIDMLKTKANAPATLWLDWLNHDYSECMELIEGAENAKSNKQNLYNQFEEWVHNDYINLYCLDYNEIADGLNSQKTVYADSVSFTQIRDINAGDSGYIYDYIQKTCQPENSVEYKKCYFTADNKDVFTIDQYGAFVAESAGQVTLTYDKGGALENSITITVGEKREEDHHNYYDDFEYSLRGDYAVITKYVGSRNTVVIPSSINECTVYMINDSAFKNCNNVIDVTVPDTLTNISSSAFYGCTNLKSIVLSKNLKYIGANAFYGCTSLSSISLPNTLQEIGFGCFYNCKNLIKVTIPNGIKKIETNTFSNCDSLEIINIPESVENISTGSSGGIIAFSNCISLTNINVDENNSMFSSSDGVLFNKSESKLLVYPSGRKNETYIFPDTVKDIESGAFQNCIYITSLSLPENIKIIWNHVFSGCSNLSDIKLPWGLSQICTGAFEDCINLEEIIIPSTVTQISQSVFSGCRKLKSISLPNGVTYLNDYIFKDCSNLESIILSPNLVNISNEAFENCVKLEQISIPEGVEWIGYSAFEGCSSLKSVLIPDTVTSFGNSCFRGCKELYEITIPNSVTYIGRYAFKDCANLDTITISQNISIIGESTFENCIKLTNISIPKDVRSIGESAFRNCSSLKSLEIPDNVIYIGEDTFRGCIRLTNIKIGNSVTEIPSYVFYGCTGLKNIIIPDNVTNIGKYAFYGCIELTNVTIGNGVIKIGDFAFHNCTALTSVTVGNSVTEIGSYAFQGCTELTSITIPDSVTYIGKYAFYGCIELTNVTIGNGVIKIGDFAFHNCTALTSVTVGNSVTEIGSYAFQGCTELTSITIPDSVTYIGEYVFYGCTGLTSIAIGNSVVEIGLGAFSGCTGLTSITIPNSVTKIASYTFYWCTGLTSVTIPNSATYIGSSAFSYCTELTSIIISESVTEIGRNAFNCCYNLEHVLYLGNKEQWNSIDISNEGNENLTNATIHFNSRLAERIAPNCTNRGYDLYSCSECDDLFKINYANALGHSFINGICERCGRDELDCIESEHPYTDDADKSWTIYKEGAKRIAITFSEETKTESACDYIYLYDMNGDEVGCYSGTELSGKRIVIQGDTVKIRLTSDSSSAYYGFSIIDVQPYYEECTHPETELINVSEAGCGWEGYTGDVYCAECHEILLYGEYIDATGKHEFKDGVCKICGQPDLDLVEIIPDNFTQSIEISYEGEYKYYKYIPSVDGTLNFYANGSYDTIGFIYDSNMQLLIYGDDSQEDYNFNISYDVTAGETYILACSMYNSDTLGTFNINVSLEPIEHNQNLIGDVNGDGKINIDDVTLIQKYIAEMANLTDNQRLVADTTKDGSISIDDVTAIQKYVANLIDKLG